MLSRLALAAALPITQPSPTRILFIGNSLTYSNDLPAMVCGMARSAGRQAACESVAKPDCGLEEHWNERDARQAITRGWGVVVLQQGPSALPESRRRPAEESRAQHRSRVPLIPVCRSLTSSS